MIIEEYGPRHRVVGHRGSTDLSWVKIVFGLEPPTTVPFERVAGSIRRVNTILAAVNHKHPTFLIECRACKYRSARGRLTLDVRPISIFSNKQPAGVLVSIHRDCGKTREKQYAFIDGIVCHSRIHHGLGRQPPKPLPLPTRVSTNCERS